MRIEMITLEKFLGNDLLAKIKSLSEEFNQRVTIFFDGSCLEEGEDVISKFSRIPVCFNFDLLDLNPSSITELRSELSILFARDEGIIFEVNEVDKFVKVVWVGTFSCSPAKDDVLAEYLYGLVQKTVLLIHAVENNERFQILDLDDEISF